MILPKMTYKTKRIVQIDRKLICFIVAYIGVYVNKKVTLKLFKVSD